MKNTVTIHDVARHASVSVGTVSRYLNGYHLREYNRVEVERSIQELGFTSNYFARRLRSKRTSTIGVVIPTLLDPFITAIIASLVHAVNQWGYSLLISDYEEDPRLVARKIQELNERMVDGIVLFPRGEKQLFGLQQNELRAPLVIVDEDFNLLPCDKVVLDNKQGSYDATTKLIKSGHRKIGIINGRRDSSVSLGRYEGFCQAMRTYQIPIDPNLVEWGEFTTQGGYICGKKLMKLETPPSALIVTNHLMTLGTLMAAYELNIRIPAFLSIIGFGNYDLTKIAQPPLTVIEQPIDDMSKAVSDILRSRIVEGDTSPPREVEMRANLVVRQSTRDL